MAAFYYTDSPLCNQAVILWAMGKKRAPKVQSMGLTFKGV